MKDKKQNIFKIVLTGPESSGKTILAEALAGALDTAWSPEFARSYLAHSGYPYTREDLSLIGRGQQAWERWYAEQVSRVLICDTDWTVLQIWEHYRFGAPSDGIWCWQKGYTDPKPADLYLLCVPDFSPEPDPLRENPEERTILFEWYEQLLSSMGANYLTLHGAHSNRLKQVISRIEKIFGTLIS